MDFEAIMNMAKEFQDKIPDQLAKMAVTGSAGGEAVKIVINGKKEITNVQISPNAPKDPELLADLILAAANGAYAQVEREVAQMLPGGLGSGGMDLSSLMDMFRK